MLGGADGPQVACGIRRDLTEAARRAGTDEGIDHARVELGACASTELVDRLQEIERRVVVGVVMVVMRVGMLMRIVRCVTVALGRGPILVPVLVLIGASAQVPLRVCLETLLAAAGAEVVGLPLELGAISGAGGVDLHPAHRVDRD